jgi:hypothetical protein
MGGEMSWTDKQKMMLSGIPIDIGLGKDKANVWMYREPSGLSIYMDRNQSRGFIPIKTIRAYVRSHDRARKCQP